METTGVKCFRLFCIKCIKEVERVLKSLEIQIYDEITVGNSEKPTTFLFLYIMLCV